MKTGTEWGVAGEELKIFSSLHFMTTQNTLKMHRDETRGRKSVSGSYRDVSRFVMFFDLDGSPVMLQRKSRALLSH